MIKENLGVNVQVQDLDYSTFMEGCGTRRRTAAAISSLPWCPTSLTLWMAATC